MAKRRGNNNNNYFTRNIEQKGEDFLSYKNSKEIENDAPRIFRELAKGRIDIESQGFYFLNPHFLNGLINCASYNYTHHKISYDGVTLMIKMYNIMIDSVLYTQEQHMKKMNAYQIILDHLYALKNSKDLNILYNMINNLSNYRFII